MKEEITINLDLPPEKRWLFLEKYKVEIDEMIGYYLDDLSDISFFEDLIEEYKQGFVPISYQKEIRSIAQFSQYSENQILLTNLYYDALKFVFGCTSFAVQNDDRMIHARNLDWWTKNDVLNKHTKVFHFSKNGKTVFTSISWCGFIGVLSGMRHDGYSVTLNAVLSEESPNFAQPVTFLLRDVLENEPNYQRAVQQLCTTPIASDCLLMIVGKNKGEMNVIERTPTQFEIRQAKDNYLIVTNDYKQMKGEKQTGDILQTSSCGRYNQAEALLQKSLPQNEIEAFKVLNDKKVKMNITVQQMVFDLTDNKIILL
ncbi:MAG: C45 family peptidase [Chitinophagales bacterium]